ncbi:MAG TPA: hypothetical protein VNL37_06670, partial [Candidatus Polarisedimenticolia bacterium]|nr:hypothetical protein [Candidatus Polarisedimenticolia bacterium]
VGALVLGRHLGQRGPAFVLRERTQLTTSGNVQLSAISPDGKQLAYFVKSCTEAACTYPLLVQDVGGTTTRTILGGATSAYGIDWSPDRRNLIVTTTIDGRFGTYLVSALGGTPRYLTSTGAAFWDGGDSLIVGPPRVPDSVFYLHVTSLDGSGRDSIRVPGPGAGVADLAVSPDGRWIFAEVGGGQDVVVVVEDRTGRVAGRWSQTGFSYYRVTRDALWLGGGWGLVDKAVVRVPFDPAQGTLGSRGDTVFSGVFAGLSLPDDGSALVLDQGSAEYSLWALDMADALRGRFPEAGLLLRSTTWAVVGVSSDGGMLLIGRQLPSAGGRTAVRLSVRPWAGGPETPVAGSGEPVYAYLVDSTTIALATKTPQGVHLAAVNVRTGTERLGLDLPVSKVTEFAMLPDGWAWIPPGNDSIIVSRGGRRSAIPRPAWFSTLHTVSAEANGHRLVFTGWNTATFDSLGVAVVPVDGGTPTLWTAPFAEDGGASWLPDGSVALKVQPTQDIVALYRVRGPGQVERVGVVPRPVASLEFSRDLRRAAIATRDYHGDVWMSRISRQ